MLGQFICSSKHHVLQECGESGSFPWNLGNHRTKFCGSVMSAHFGGRDFFSSFCFTGCPPWIRKLCFWGFELTEAMNQLVQTNISDQNIYGMRHPSLLFFLTHRVSVSDDGAACV